MKQVNFNIETAKEPAGFATLAETPKWVVMDSFDSIINAFRNAGMGSRFDDTDEVFDDFVIPSPAGPLRATLRLTPAQFFQRGEIWIADSPHPLSARRAWALS